MNFPFKFQLKQKFPFTLHNIIKVILVILHSTGKFWVFSYFLLFPNPPHFRQSSTSWPFTSLYYFPPHPSYIPSPLSLSLFLCAMVGGEWVCGGLICSLKRHASPSNASCRSFPSSFYPSLSLSFIQWEIVKPMFNLNHRLCLKIISQHTHTQNVYIYIFILSLCWCWLKPLPYSAA